VLRVATEGTYSPFSFHAPGTNELTGYDVEVIEAVAEELGMEVEFSETQFDAIFAGLEADRYDVIANQITINRGAAGQVPVLPAVHGVDRGGRHHGRRHQRRRARGRQGQDERPVDDELLRRARRGAGAQVEAVEGFARP
jgi:membrane-bound lytic murein transglycosylase MltF